MHRINTTLAFAALSLAFAAGCSGVGPGGRTIGAACSTDRDCTNRCVTGDRHYPGGICSLSCTSDAQCPAGSACIDDSGGICMATCQNNSDCSAFGRGFLCDRENRVGASGEVSVCRVP